MADLYDLADLEMLANDSLCRAGVSRAIAGEVARDIALSEIAGDSDGGFSGLLRDIRLIRYGRLHPNAEVTFDTPAPAVLRAEGGHGFAASALAKAIPQLTPMARRQGLAMAHLSRVSEPGAMAAALLRLADVGFAGMAMRQQGTAYAVRPNATQIAVLETGMQRRHREDPLASLLALAPPPADTPLDGPVTHSGWLVAIDPEVTAVDDLLADLPHVPPKSEASPIAISPGLLAQIINA